METVLAQLRTYDPATLITDKVGISITSARIFLCLLVAFFLSFSYRPLISKLPPLLQHIVNAVIGSSLVYYCFGNDVINLLFDVFIVVFIVKTIGGTFLSVVVTWILIFGHLLYGYYRIITSEDMGRLDWTVPGCIICLKLIGLVSDLHDTVVANRREEKDIKRIPLKSTKVGILEIVGYSTCFTTCMVGPIVTFQRYLDFTKGTLYNQQTTATSIPYGILRFSTGILFVVIYSVLLPYVPLDYFVSAEYVAQPFVYKFFLAALRYKVIFKQYTSVWLIAEGGAVVTGLAYNGKDKEGRDDWSGCAGVRVVALDGALYLQEIINSFNLTTNDWVLQHVYKKCKFLNSKMASQTISLIFLAAFHGFLPGYFICFGHEIVMVTVEKQIMDYGVIKFGPFSSWPMIIRVISVPFLYLYHLLGMTLTVGVFQLLTIDRCLTYMSALNYYTFYLYLILVPLGYYLEVQVKRERKRRTIGDKKNE